MASPEHKEWTNWVLAQVRSINPYPHKANDSKSSIYAYGFLASVLATILKEDPILRKQFTRLIEQNKRK